MKIPKIKIIQGYQDVFDEDPPKDRLAFVRNLSSEHILLEIVAVNNTLKPPNDINIDHSWKTQNKLLHKFTYNNKNYKYVLEKCLITSHERAEIMSFFNRHSCLFAIEEVLSCKEIKTNPNFVMNREDVWFNIFKYLLCVNSVVSKFQDDDTKRGLENLNPKLLPLNEFYIETNPFYTLLRGLNLFDYFSKDREYSSHIKEYLLKSYGEEKKNFFLKIISYIYSFKHDQEELNRIYLRQFKTPDKFILKMSERNNIYDTHKLLDIRKSPLIRCAKNQYILTDSTFLIEKTYNQFLNDFWFDYLKELKTDTNKNVFTYKDYKSKFGYFFESYVDRIFKNMLSNYKYSILKTFNELKINKRKGEDEIADLYFRYGKRIIIGQVKAGSIYDKEKYGASIESLYKKNREKFFDDFGVNQIVKSILKIEENYLHFDNKYPKDKNRIFYPIIIFNDKLFQTALMPDVFNQRFQELIKDIKIEKMIIKPLSIIHVSDIEYLQYSLKTNPKLIWTILEQNCSDPHSMAPFYDSIYRLNIRDLNLTEFIAELKNELQ